MIVHLLDGYILWGVVHHLDSAVLMDVAVEVVRPSLSGIYTGFGARWSCEGIGK